MGRFRRDGLERELRARRPEPRRELVDEIADRVVHESRHGAGRPARIGLAVALSAGMLGALGAFGGLSYAANGVTHAVSSAVHVVTPTKHVVPSTAVSSSMAQYKVALCFHGHTLNVDSHAVHALTSHGATIGACGGSGNFKPSTSLITMCFAGRNITVAKSEEKALAKLGFKRGFCKA